MARQRRKQVPVSPVPTTTELAWFYGRNAGDADATKLAREFKRCAELERVDDSPLLGAWETGSGVMVGALINGAPVVRAEPEEREGLSARHFAAVRVRWRVSTLDDPEGALDWNECMCAALGALEGLPARSDAPRVDVAMEWDPPLQPVGYHLVSLRGAVGLLVFGALLPGAGATFTGDVDTFTLTRDGVTLRVVGLTLARVDASSPVMLLPSEPSHSWREEARARVASACPEAKPEELTFWLVVPT
jgi:hypothetical protein